MRSFGAVFETYLERNVLASQRLFEAAARDGVRVVFASSSSIYGEAERYPTSEEVVPRPVSPYGITKLACEHPAVPGDQRRTKADTSLIGHDLGWRPTTSLSEGLSEQWAWAASRLAAR